jgi:septum formation protein
MSFWKHQTRKVILASGSPRRRDLLQQMGFSFEVMKGEPITEKEFIDIADLDGSLQKLAVAKAHSVTEQHPEALVLSADTVVVRDGEILGKPSGRSDAKSMLRTLSGCSHTVMTGVALSCRENAFCQAASVRTTVIFRDLSDAEIEWYLDSNEPYDKAGAYGIQGRAMIFVDKIEGCFYNVVGLPVSGTISLFKAFNS